MKYILIFLLSFPLTGFSQEQNYITNKEYNEFVTYVRDSSLMHTMGQEVDEEAYHISTWDNENYKGKDTFVSVKWKTKLDVNSPEAREALEPWYFEPNERLNHKREFDTRKFIHNGVKIYPDVMVWCRDSTINKSWATFLATYYYVHPYFENHPVYGLSQQQINEYLKWRYPHQEKNSHLNYTYSLDLTLPKEKLQFTVGEYFEFYQYTRDSVVRIILGEEIDEYKYLKFVNKYDEDISPPIAKWKYKIKWEEEQINQTLKSNKILAPNNQINNMRLMFDYTWLDYYRAITLPDSTNRNLYFGRMMINLGIDHLINEYSNINIKKELKNKDEVIYSNFISGQIRAYFYWKKSEFPKKDVFDGFIPFGNHTSREVDPDNFMKDNDMELFRIGKLTNAFYNFQLTIPVITIE